MIDTDETLLRRVRRLDAHDAWQVFFRQYWAVILRYTRKLGLSAHQGEEVLQETMVELMRILPEFDYDRRKGRFRNFLLTIVHRKSLRVLKRARLDASSVAAEAVEDIADVDSEQMRVAEIRWRESIRDIVLDRLQRLVDFKTYQVFSDYVLKGKSAEAVAQIHGLKLNGVYQIKNRLTRLLQRDTEALLKDSELG